MSETSPNSPNAPAASRATPVHFLDRHRRSPGGGTGVATLVPARDEPTVDLAPAAALPPETAMALGEQPAVDAPPRARRGHRTGTADAKTLKNSKRGSRSTDGQSGRHPTGSG